MYFFLGLGIFCIAYWLLICRYAGVTADFAWIWPVSGLLCVELWRQTQKDPGVFQTFPAWLKISSVIAALILFCFALFLLVVILRGMVKKGEKNLPYVIILGAQVRGTKPSRALVKRLVRAEEYARENPDTIFILSGGKGSGEDITEARCMEEWMLERRISKERLILEEDSTSTLENLKFSHDLTGCGEVPTGILSNDFHVSRALYLAKISGYKKVYGIPAKGDPVMELHYIVREMFAFIKAWLKKPDQLK